MLPGDFQQDREKLVVPEIKGFAASAMGEGKRSTKDAVRKTEKMLEILQSLH